MLAQFKVGDEIRHSVLMRLHKAGQSSNGGIFARGTIEDNSATINFICFERDVVEQIKMLTAASAVIVSGIMQPDRFAGDKSIQVLIRRLEQVTDADDLSHLVPYTPQNIVEYESLLADLIAGVVKPHLKQLLQRILSGETYNNFTKHTAAMRVHHAYVGGLLEHSVDVARLAKAMAGEFAGVDIDLIVTGALLHDIGKLYELSNDIGFEYTDVGRMIGHVSLGAMLVERSIHNQKDFPQEDLQHLLHILLSHHGKVENGAPVACVTKESFIVHYADELNSILNQFTTDDSQSKGNWRYLRTLGRYVRLQHD